MASDREIIRELGKVGHAFFGRFESLRDVQRQSIPPILSGRNTLVSSATASGKTEAVFAPLVSRIRSGRAEKDPRIKILAVAPTRALVNDLHTRLERPLFELGWSCGRQTSDHREKYKYPEVLVTTPESFDSMLVRGATRKQGILVDHLLAGIEAVFIDEAHLFDASPRGDQIAWLLGRLRRLKCFARSNGWIDNENLQICGASATLPKPRTLAEKILSKDSIVVVVGGHREMEIFSEHGPIRWIGFDSLNDLAAIYNHILLSSGPDPIRTMVRFVWMALEEGKDDGCRKMLVFVPSRALCDKLSLALSDTIKKHRDIFVGAHHGSLDKVLREHAEQKFMTSRDAVLVATTTLEVGIDIGDVDVVALIGAPSNTSSLLQRIGRSGRRKGCVRILPIAGNPIEARAFSSMLEAAFNGTLDATPSTRLWSVFIQQAASYTAQSGKADRFRNDLIKLAQDVWPEREGPAIAARILNHLIEIDILEEKNSRLYLGSAWSDQFERGGGDLHHNFESEATGIPVIDSSTGEVLARVARPPASQTAIALAGQRWDMVSEGGELIIKSSQTREKGETFQYASRRAPTSMSFAEHVRKGLGFESEEAPLVELGTQTLWFHFGGSAYESVLTSFFPDLKRVMGLCGLALNGSISEENLKALTNTRKSLMARLTNIADSIVPSLSMGKHHKDLPIEVRTAVAMDAFGPDKFIEWVHSRRIKSLRENDQRYRNLLHDLI